MFNMQFTFRVKRKAAYEKGLLSSEKFYPEL